MRKKLEGIKNGSNIQSTMDVIGLVKGIQPLWYHDDFMALCHDKGCMYMMYQVKLSDDAFVKKFSLLWYTVVQHGGSYANKPGLIKETYKEKGLDPHVDLFVPMAQQRSAAKDFVSQRV